MKGFLKDKLVLIIKYSLLYLPTPKNINYWWNFGSILGICLLVQIFSGLFLSMHYCPHVDMAFDSVIHIIQDVKYGWFVRNLHMNGASVYFICMYLHIGRGLYYHSFKFKETWLLGVIIYLMSMGTAFLGYILPWGQMSLWGATVITNLISAIPYIGLDVVRWLWGGYSVNNATLNRFYSLHFILPLIIVILVGFHLYFLHKTGSGNPLGVNSDYNKVSFHFYFIIKDLLGFLLLFLFYIVLVYLKPYFFSDPDNFIKANFMVTPVHIQPEWYFLFAYAILRSIPSKFGGVIGLLLSILILMILPFTIGFYDLGTTKFYPTNRFLYWMFICVFFMLTWLGGKVVEYPYVLLTQIHSVMYFFYFLMMPFLNSFWDNILKPDIK